jgi:hypothetical protein
MPAVYIPGKLNEPCQSIRTKNETDNTILISLMVLNSMITISLLILLILMIFTYLKNILKLQDGMAKKPTGFFAPGLTLNSPNFVMMRENRIKKYRNARSEQFYDIVNL